jgi:hypothetical protein
MLTEGDQFGVAEAFVIVPGQGLKCVVSGINSLAQNIHTRAKDIMQHNRY